MNPLYLRINHASGYIEEKDGNKYLIFNSTDENKELLKRYNDVWGEGGLTNKIKTINCGKGHDYKKEYMNIKLNSDDDLPLKKPLIFHSINITIRSIFDEDDKLYPQVFLDDTFYELNV